MSLPMRSSGVSKENDLKRSMHAIFHGKIDAEVIDMVCGGCNYDETMAVEQLLALCQEEPETTFIPLHPEPLVPKSNALPNDIIIQPCSKPGNVFEQLSATPVYMACKVDRGLAIGLHDHSKTLGRVFEQRSDVDRNDALAMPAVPVESMSNKFQPNLQEFVVENALLPLLSTLPQTVTGEMPSASSHSSAFSPMGSKLYQSEGKHVTCATVGPGVSDNESGKTLSDLPSDHSGQKYKFGTSACDSFSANSMSVSCMALPRVVKPFAREDTLSSAESCVKRSTLSVPVSGSMQIELTEAEKQIDGLRLLIAASRRPVMIVLRGMPGSGKSFIANSLRGEHGVICSTDSFFISPSGLYKYDPFRLQEAHLWNQSKAKKAVEDCVSPLIIDNTNTEKWEMKPYVAAAVRRDYHVEIAEPKTWWAWNVRELSRRNCHGVSASKISAMMERYERCESVSEILGSSRIDRKVLPVNLSSVNHVPNSSRMIAGGFSKNSDQFDKPPTEAAEVTFAPGKMRSPELVDLTEDPKPSRNSDSSDQPMEFIDCRPNSDNEGPLVTRQYSAEGSKDACQAYSGDFASLKQLSSCCGIGLQGRDDRSSLVMPCVRRNCQPHVVSNTSDFATNVVEVSSRSGISRNESSIQERNQVGSPKVFSFDDKLEQVALTKERLVDGVHGVYDVSERPVRSATSTSLKEVSKQSDLRTTSFELESSSSAITRIDSDVVDMVDVCQSGCFGTSASVDISKDSSSNNVAALAGEIQKSSIADSVFEMSTLCKQSEIVQVPLSSNSDVSNMDSSSINSCHETPSFAETSNYQACEARDEMVSHDFSLQFLYECFPSYKKSYIRDWLMRYSGDLMKTCDYLSRSSQPSALPEVLVVPDDENENQALDFDDVTDNHVDDTPSLEGIQQPLSSTSLMSKPTPSRDAGIYDMSDQTSEGNGTFFYEQVTQDGFSTETTRRSPLGEMFFCQTGLLPEGSRHSSLFRISLDQRLAVELSNRFGKEGNHASDTWTQDELLVDLDPQLARGLYECWMASIGENRKKRQMMISADELLAQKLQAEEDLLASNPMDGKGRSRKRKTKTVLPVQTNYVSGASAAVTGTGTFSSNPWLSPQRISGPLHAAIRSDYEQMSPLNNKASGKELSCQQQLQRIFPGVDEVALKEVLESQSYNLDAAINIVQTSCGLGVAPKNVCAPGYDHMKNSASLKKQGDGVVDNRINYGSPPRKKLTPPPLKENISSPLIIDAKFPSEAGSDLRTRYQTWDQPEYQDFRAEATMHANLRAEFFQKAMKAFQEKQGELAQHYASQANRHGKLMKEAHARAAELILRYRNQQNMIYKRVIDLHGLHVEEALNALENFLLNAEKARFDSVEVITGRGNNSKGGVSMVRKNVISYLHSRGYNFKLLHHGGSLRIRLT